MVPNVWPADQLQPGPRGDHCERCRYKCGPRLPHKGGNMRVLRLHRFRPLVEIFPSSTTSAPSGPSAPPEPEPEPFSSHFHPALKSVASAWVGFAAPTEPRL